MQMSDAVFTSTAVITSFSLYCHQSTLAEKPLNQLGSYTMPAVSTSPVSGFRSGLPDRMPDTWPLSWVKLPSSGTLVQNAARPGLTAASAAVRRTQGSEYVVDVEALAP